MEGIWGHGPEIFLVFSCSERASIVQSKANSYSTAIENHDFMPLLTCCMKLKCIVGH